MPKCLDIISARFFALIFILMPLTGIPQVNPNSLYKTYEHLPVLNVKLEKVDFAHCSHMFSDELLQGLCFASI